MEAYIQGDISTGDGEMKTTRSLYETALGKCGEIGDKMKNIADQYDALENRPDWGKISKTIYDDNKKEIDRNIDFELEAWKTGVYFNSGMFAGFI
jgi:hypothetical protein